MNTDAQPPLIEARDARGVITLTLNRPRPTTRCPRRCSAQLQAELDALAGDAHARVLVLAGAGKAFCAGHDLREMRTQPDRGLLPASCSRAAAA